VSFRDLLVSVSIVCKYCHSLVYNESLPLPDMVDLRLSYTRGISLHKLNFGSKGLCVRMHSNVSDVTVRALSGLPIRALYLPRCFNITQRVYPVIASMRRLTTLDLSSVVSCTNHSIRILNTLRLRHLTLDYSRVTDEGLAAIKTHMLEHLSLRNNNTFDEGLSSFISCRLRYLNLSNCFNLTNRCLSFFSDQPLQVIILSNCFWVNDESMSHFIHMPLQHLSVPNCDITDNGLRTLSCVGSLRFLDITWCVSVTWEGIRALRGKSGKVNSDTKPPGGAIRIVAHGCPLVQVPGGTGIICTRD
jgi:hypothetical protein